MKIYDCFTYFDEEHLAEIRLNTLKDSVDFFVICEAKENHKGISKKLNFPLEKFKQIKHKIIYLTLDKFPKLNSTWKRQDYQRDYLMNGLENAAKNDLILFSDADEIPNPLILNKYKKDDGSVGIFIQKFFYYKLNVSVPTYSQWEGTRSCRKKNLKSFSWLRNKVKIKNLKYKFWRIDKYKNITKIENGGWHFSFLGNPAFIASKIKSYVHNEYDTEEYTNLEKINLRIKNLIDPFDRNKKLTKVLIDETYPDYIIKNQDKYKDLIL
jgi:beta-1,4-mannosyl-glycoprotein beta-1,4-N-acetylglucosaminyltransferase